MIAVSATSCFPPCPFLLPFRPCLTRMTGPCRARLPPLFVGDWGGAAAAGDAKLPNAAAAATSGIGPNQQLRARNLPAAAVTVKLDFEGLADGQQVGSYYNGGGGRPDYGIVFGGTFVASVSRDAGGSGTFPTAPSPNTTFTFGHTDFDLAYMTVDAGQYSVGDELGVVLYDGPDKTGNVLLNVLTPRHHGEWSDFTFQGPPGSAAAKSMRLHVPGTVPFIDDVVVTLVSLPTKAPSKPPTSFPTRAPSKPPTKSPTTTAPTASPTKPPTKFPTTVPTNVPSCHGTTHWVYNADTNAPIRPLVNSSTTCLVHPYSVEVRPCIGGVPLPSGIHLSMKLVRAFPDRRRTVVVHHQVDADAPYFLFGDAAGTGNDVRPSPGPLPNGNYRLLTSSVAGGGYKGTVLAFAQSCPPCPKGKKGMKGCTKMRALNDNN
jgi:hypothetical protein